MRNDAKTPSDPSWRPWGPLDANVVTSVTVLDTWPLEAHVNSLTLKLLQLCLVTNYYYFHYYYSTKSSQNVWINTWKAIFRPSKTTWIGVSLNFQQDLMFMYLRDILFFVKDFQLYMSYWAPHYNVLCFKIKILIEANYRLIFRFLF